MIESGGYANDREKQEIRKLNYVSILSALYTIANKSYLDISLEDYEKIPRNDRKLFDLKIENVTYELNGNDYILDLGINRNEIDKEGHSDFYYKSSVVDQGDLSTYYGYETFDASGYTIVPATTGVSMRKELSLEQVWPMTKEGVGYIEFDLPESGFFTKSPAHLVPKGYQSNEFVLKPGINPTFFLQKEGKLTHAVINGFLLDLSQPLENQKFGNALILR